jgi:hypothetical protein
MNTLEKPPEISPAPAAPLTVFIAYGDVPAGCRAMDLVGTLAHRLQGEMEVRAQPWRIAMLDHAFCDAVADTAEIVVLAVSDADSVQASSDWLMEFLSRRHGEMPAVVAMVGTDSSPTSSNDAVAVELLRAVAVQKGAMFFTADPVAALMLV